MKRPRKRTAKHLALELNELDYLDKLSDEERDYILRFYYGYYQGEADGIQTPEMIREGSKRNNSSKRQIHSVGRNLLEEAAARARNYQETDLKKRYYVPEDYHKDYLVGYYDDTDDEELDGNE